MIKKFYVCYLCEKQYENKLNTIKLNNKEEHICINCINQLKNLIGKQMRYMRKKICELDEDVNLLKEERIARNKAKLKLLYNNEKTPFYPIENDNIIGTKIYFVPTDADIVRETIIRGCVKNDKGERFLIIDPSDKKLDFESLKLKDDNHIYTNKADAEKHLQDLLEEQGE